MVPISLFLCATFALSSALPLDEVISAPQADLLPETKAVEQNMLLEELLSGEMAAEEREVLTGEMTEDKEGSQTDEMAEEEGQLLAGEMAAEEREVLTGEMTEDKEGLQTDEMAEEEGQLLAGEMAAAELLCPSGWFKYGSRCFKFFNSPTYWPSAERYCIHFGANLASVHSSGEYYFLQELVRRGTGGFPRTWIGGTDAAKNRLWFWSDGSRFDYQNWARGEPNNSGRREPCIEMNYGADSLWNDVRCEYHSFPFICAKRLIC